MSPEPLAPKRRQGSVADFDRAWVEALRHGSGFWYSYPASRPTTQYELFEQLKVVEIDAILQRLGVCQGLVLEYGCGSASISLYLVNRGFDAIACDISLNALAVAELNRRRHVGEDATGTFRRSAGDSLRLPFATDSFDVVMSYGLLEHFDPAIVDDLLREVLRTLRPGGLFIADIVHRRFSVRTLGMWLSMFGSLCYRAVSLRWRGLSRIPALYLDALYENELDDRAWLAALRRAGLPDVELKILHPFSPLALPIRLERIYVGLMQRGRRAWEWFDRAQPGWGRWWGWLYLVWGTKPPQ